jgi:hypothetical protein
MARSWCAISTSRWIPRCAVGSARSLTIPSRYRWVRSCARSPSGASKRREVLISTRASHGSPCPWSDGVAPRVGERVGVQQPPSTVKPRPYPCPRPSPNPPQAETRTGGMVIRAAANPDSSQIRTEAGSPFLAHGRHRQSFSVRATWLTFRGAFANLSGAGRPPQEGGLTISGRWGGLHEISVACCCRRCGSCCWLQRRGFREQRRRQGHARRYRCELPALRRIERRNDHGVQHGKTLPERAHGRGRPAQHPGCCRRLQRLLRRDRQRRQLGRLLPLHRRRVELAKQPRARIPRRRVYSRRRLSGS